MMKIIRNISLSISFSVFIYSFAWSQHKAEFSEFYEPEKIYLQLDCNVYTNNQTIWYKAVVTMASDNTPSEISGVLYVDLIGPEEKLIEKKLLKLNKGVGSGFFDLNQNYPEGRYLIRAYTEWDKNFGSDFFFNEYIQVFSLSSKTKSEPINNITLIEKNNSGRHLTANLDPVLIDSLHKKDLIFIITHDHISDTLSVGKKDDNKYILEYDIPDSCQFVTLKMLTKNLFSYTKTIVLDEDHLDLQFFPESGELVHGIASRIGFKALGYNGKGKSVSGEIITDKGTSLTTFKSNQLGIGSFFLNNPDMNDKYFARLKSQTDSNLSNIYPLPKVVFQGNVLSVSNEKNNILITASSNYSGNDSIFINVSCRSILCYEIKGQLNRGLLRFYLPADSLPEGIIAFTMLDKSKSPVAERLYFNERQDNRINITISTDKDSYKQRDLTKLNIKTFNKKGESLASRLSLLVLNKQVMGQNQSQHQNILSYLLLSSDLKGEIENPGRYFSDDSHFADLDELMLTQGWRRYLYNKPVDKLIFKPESRLNLSGTVSGLLARKKNREAEITVMTFGPHKAVQTLVTDSLGKFFFNLNDEYGQNINILIQSASRSGKKKDFKIVLDKKESPEIVFNHVPSVGKVDSVVHRIIEKNTELKKVDETFKLSKGILLNEVRVEAYKMTPARKKVMQEYGRPDEVISGEKIQEEEEKWSYGLYSVLQSKFGDKIRIFRIWDGELIAEIRKSAPTLVMVEGITVNHNDFNYIAYIPPGEVSSFEIIENIDNRKKVWFEFCPECDPLSIPPSIDVIAIYTHAGNGLFGVQKSRGIFKAVVPVFSTPREFYSPKYENLSASDWYKPDLRALIYWDPLLISDSSGQTFVNFYNADIPGQMEVVVEAISENGEIGYKEINYSVSKREHEK